MFILVNSRVLTERAISRGSRARQILGLSGRASPEANVRAASPERAAPRADRCRFLPMHLSRFAARTQDGCVLPRLFNEHGIMDKEQCLKLIQLYGEYRLLWAYLLTQLVICFCI